MGDQTDDQQTTTVIDATALEVETLKGKCERLQETLKAYNVAINYEIANLAEARANLRADALVKLLVAKGLFTQDEYDRMFYEQVHELLGVVLVKVEETMAQTKKPAPVVAVQKSGIIVPNRGRHIH